MHTRVLVPSVSGTLPASLQAAQGDPHFMQLVARWEQAVGRVEGMLDQQKQQQPQQQQ